MVIFLVVLVTFGTILELLSLRDNFSNIRYHCVPSKYGCEPGEVFQLRTTVSNYGLRTIPFLKLEEIFPKDINILANDKMFPKDINNLADDKMFPKDINNLAEDNKVMADDRCCIHVSMLYIRGRQKITRTIQAALPQRGLYLLEGCKVLGGDFLGIRENSMKVEQREEIIIFPKLLNDDTILRALSGYYGDFSVRRFYIEDPILVSSYRDYTGREPMRSISWAQSARKNQLMVKEFDHTMDLSVTILLDVYLHWSEGVLREQLEYCFSLVRTIAEFLERKKVSYRLLTNAYNRSGNAAYEALTKAGQGSHHFTTLLYTLGQADSNTFRNIDDLYNMAIQSYSGENAIFYVAPFGNAKRDIVVKNLQNRLGSQVYPMYASASQEVDKDDV